MSKIEAIFLMLLLLQQLSFAKEALLTSKVEKNSYNVGDAISIEIEVEGKDFKLEEIDDEKLEPFEIISKEEIFIEESSIENNNKTLTYTRNKVDRFTGGVAQGALFSESISNQGVVDLAMEIKGYKNYEVGLVLLAVCELWYGLQPIGGTTSVGRGILEGISIQLNNDEEQINDILKSDKVQFYFNELAKFINEDTNKN